MLFYERFQELGHLYSSAEYFVKWEDGEEKWEKLEKVKTHGVSHYFPAESKKIGHDYLLLT